MRDLFIHEKALISCLTRNASQPNDIKSTSLANKIRREKLLERKDASPLQLRHLTLIPKKILLIPKIILTNHPNRLKTLQPSHSQILQIRKIACRTIRQIHQKTPNINPNQEKGELNQGQFGIHEEE